MQLPLPLPELDLGAGSGFPPPYARRIYCNRSLRLDRIQMVGFDMDYTLAIYRQPEMDRLSIEATARKLVDRGYPEALLSMPFRTDFPVRGLLIDRKLGNVLKMDRYRYVKRAYHGMRLLTRDERRELYHSQRLRPGSGRYHWVDTLYALSEVAVYAAAIDALEALGRTVDYETLFADVRACIDLAHQDGTILDAVMADLPRYLERDPELGPTLHNLRSSGKRLFLLTNSRAEYSDRVMRYLLDGAMPEYPSWRNYFDIVITAAGKPRFFTHSVPFEEVTPTGSRVVTSFERGKLYMGGNIADFERMTELGGDRVLYVGDHIYGDVLRVKKESAWRTVMILQEMTDELSALETCGEALERLDWLEEVRGRLYEDLRDRQVRLRSLQRRFEQAASEGLPPTTELESARLRHRRAIERLKARIKTIDTESEELDAAIDRAHHPFWGSFFKAGSEVSSFGDQVEEYACLYTSRVSNFLAYSPMHYFRSPRDRMPHEL